MTAIEIVQQTLGEQVGVDSSDALEQSKHSTAPFGLLHLFQAGRAILASQQAEFEKVSVLHANQQFGFPHHSKGSPNTCCFAFQKMLPKLQEQNYFGGAAEGSADYSSRLAHV